MIEGYRLVGSGGRFCTTAKTLTQEDPTCEVIRCPSPPIINDGIVLDNGRTDFVYSDMVRYECNEGFVKKIAIYSIDDMILLLRPFFKTNHL